MPPHRAGECRGRLPRRRASRWIWGRSTGTWRGSRSRADPVLSRILVALGLAAAVVSGTAVAFLRTDFVANTLCAYAVATIEEATAARVDVSRCSVEPEQGKLTIEGLRVGDPGGRIELDVARVFAKVKVRPLLQQVRLERLEVDYPRLKLALDQAGPSPPSGGQCLPRSEERRVGKECRSRWSP